MNHLYPIIRRIRRPLIPVEVAPAPQCAAGVPPADLTVLPTPAEPAAPTPPADSAPPLLTLEPETGDAKKPKRKADAKLPAQ